MIFTTKQTEQQQKMWKEKTIVKEKCHSIWMILETFFLPSLLYMFQIDREALNHWAHKNK